MVEKRTALYVLICSVAILTSPATCARGEAEDEESVIQVDAGVWQKAYRDSSQLLVLFYKSSGCKECPQAVEEFESIAGQPELPSGVRLGKSTDEALVAELDLRSLPTLVYLRDATYVIYDGPPQVEPMLAWVGPASQVATQTLTDDSFEHLTQASTGATTGDWLVNFYKPNCKDILPALETVGVRVRGKVNVAKVDTAENPLLVERFQIAQCPHIIYFRKGKMYRYDLPKVDVASLKSFLDGFYKNSKAERIPVPKSQFDFITEGIADFLKQQLEGENRNIALVGVCVVVVSFALILLLCCRSLLQGPPKEKAE